MSTIIPNLFTTYELTDKEQLQGMLLTEQNKQVFQNERARLATERSLLTINAEDIVRSAQEESYKLGQLELMAWILESSDAANIQLNNPDYDLEDPTI